MNALPGIDGDRVTAWLEASVPGAQGPFSFETISGGHSNLTLDVVASDGMRYVLRRPPLKQVLATAHDMGREHRIIAALGATDVPVPPALGYCADESVTGAPFYVMGHVEGAILHDRERAERLLEPAARRAAGASVVDVLADLHALDPDEVGLGDLGRREDYIARQLRRWKRQYEQSATRRLPGVLEVHDALAARIPEQGPASIVHGDYKLGNLVHAPTGEVRAVLDWEICTLGDPLADLGYLLLMWPQGRSGGPWLGEAAQAEGFPSGQELLDRYARRSGRDVREIDYYMTFATWKIACILEGVYSRYLGGARGDAPEEADRFGAMALAYARQASERLREGGLDPLPATDPGSPTGGPSA